MTLKQRLAEAERQVADAREEWQAADAAYDLARERCAGKSRAEQIAETEQLFGIAQHAICMLSLSERKLSFIRDTMGVEP